MDSRRLIIFIVLSLGLMLLWEKYFAPTPNQVATTSSDSTPATTSNSFVSQVNAESSSLLQDKIITVTTDIIQAQISNIGGDLRSVDLLAHGSQEDVKRPYPLLMQANNRLFVAQTGLVALNGTSLPTHSTRFVSDRLNYVLLPNQSSVTVNLVAIESGIEVVKSYTFKRDSYVVDVTYHITNKTAKPLNGVSAYWRLLRDEEPPLGETKLVRTFTGAVYFTNEAKFNTIKFSNLSSNDTNYPENVTNGWVGFIQHYFTSLWLLNAYGYKPVCSDGVGCRFNFKSVGGGLASAGLLTDLPQIKPNSSFKVSVPLFVGPEEYKVLANTAPEMELTKDYGWVYIFATPLFWLLIKLFALVKNWGVAIIILTLVVKVVLYPLTKASYISMAKMKALAPKIEALKTQHGDDRAKLQQAMMQLYKSEKVNPIGGCLPMILQIPVFIGLYWALLSSVELRYAGFLWVHDLSTADPYYILPLILAVTMFVQTFLNPPPADPVQAKMMRIMPIAFSVMFFFFPAGLVLYWLVNNVLSMLQQWYVNNHVSLRHKNRGK